jgi:hypothetical protein
MFLGWWCDVKSLEGSAEDKSHYVVEPDDA